ncbi:MAG: methyltransferase domain-containing protein [candidate division Zixibacteria bacterium]|nr:methyltransferase domain-containing protein [candidate division Zixibacteria bacterium]
MSGKLNHQPTSHGSMPLLTEFRQLMKHYSRNLDAQAKNDYHEFKQVCDRIESRFNVKINKLKILEIGCGQRYPHALILAQSNEVHAIDLDVILTRWTPPLLFQLFKQGGFKRAAKTIIRRALFDNKYHQHLAALSGKDFNKTPNIYRMSGEKLDFPDNSFDLVFSKAVFEHIRRIDEVIPEIKRVLKPGGIIGIEINLYTGFTGGHNLLGEEPETTDVPPWDHLRQRKFPPNTYLNKLRIDDYKKAFEEHFEIVYYYEEEKRQYEKFLTPEIREELSEYSVHELLTNGMLVLAKKN